MPEVAANDGSPSIGAKDKAPVIEQYLPRNYPRLLFHGTAKGNSDSIRTQGLAKGTLTTDVGESLDERFYRKDSEGRLLIARYAPALFTTHDELYPYLRYEIKEGTGETQRIVYTNIDTDGTTFSSEQTTSRNIAPENIGSVAIDEEQAEYLDLMSKVISGSTRILGSFDEKSLQRVADMLRKHNLPDSAAGRSGEGITMSMVLEEGLQDGADLDYRTHLYQKMLAPILGIDIEDFKDFDSLQEAVSTHFHSEEDFLERVVKMFPKASEAAHIFQWDWNNLAIDDETIAKDIIRQQYQRKAIDNVKGILKGYSPVQFIEFAQSESTKGLHKLMQERGVSFEKRSITSPISAQGGSNHVDTANTIVPPINSLIDLTRFGAQPDDE